jgi:hypothetical protein
MPDIYIFDRSQMVDLLTGAIEMFQEYRDQHGRTEVQAIPAAVLEMLEGLDAERELAAYYPDHIVTSQILPVTPERTNRLTNSGQSMTASPY